MALQIFFQGKKCYTNGLVSIYSKDGYVAKGLKLLVCTVQLNAQIIFWVALLINSEKKISVHPTQCIGKIRYLEKLQRQKE